MRTPRFVLFVLFVFLTTLAQRANAQRVEATPENVVRAIDNCVSYLKAAQLKNGDRKNGWDGHTTYGCGQTCLVTLALLSAGQEITSPTVRAALTYIRGVKPTKNYEASLKVMVLCAAEPKKDMAQIKELVNWLIKNQRKNGGWGYGADGDSDESNTQFVVLALWEASKLGIEVPQECFQKGERYWLDRFVGEGWGYRNGVTIGSMTCAGIASMVILQDAMQGVDASVKGNTIQCCGGGDNKAFDVDRPLNWLAKNYAVTHNPNNASFTMYYLYALERVGRLTGQRFIGEHDWYRDGSEFLMLNQNQTAGGGIRGGGNEDDVTTSTAMALLFLSKGKRQVVIGHLQFGNGNDWQLHRRAVQNLTGNIEKVWKRELAWQQVKIEKSTVKTLLETPILFISGSKEFSLTDAQRKMLKDYTEQGGFIFAEACNGDGCNGEVFDASFKREMELIFDKPLQKLPPSHPIWTAETKVEPSALPPNFWLYGLESCCRTSVIYSPISLSCRWELARPYGPTRKLPQSVEDDIQNAVKIGVNAAAYATGRELKDKLDEVKIVLAPTNRQSLPRGSLTLPNILHTGGADDTPRSLVNLLEVYRSETQALTESKTPTLSVALADEGLEKYPLVYLHGRNSFSFSDQERAGLKKHFENMGIVIGDSICASKEFTEAVRKEFVLILPGAIWKTLDAKHPFMMLGGNGGYDINSVTLVDKQTRIEGPPLIEALEWQGRTVMLFSPNDLSCALESKHSMQCRGYVREDAFRIGINMILYALMQ